MSQKGSLTVPLLLCLLIAVLVGAGTWELLRRWRNLVELQLRLDECVGRTALELRGGLNSVAAANTRIRELRAAWYAAAGNPAAQSGLTALARIVAAGQEKDRALWEGQRLQWALRAGCARPSDLASPLPIFPWSRPPDDLVGPHPMNWTGDRGFSIHLQLAHPPRSAAARVVTTPRKGVLHEAFPLGPGPWHAGWTAPAPQPLRPGLR